jgi:signal transduction histidine kinase
LVKFIDEYINEIKPGLPEVTFVVNTNNISFETEFSILELSIIIDNLISNAIKATDKSVKIQVDVKKKSGGLRVLFSDNGSGVDNEIKDHIFEIGFTTTRGSGIGLHTSKELMRQAGGDINFVGNKTILKGATFELIF